MLGAVVIPLAACSPGTRNSARRLKLEIAKMSPPLPAARGRPHLGKGRSDGRVAGIELERALLGLHRPFHLAAGSLHGSQEPERIGGARVELDTALEGAPRLGGLAPGHVSAAQIIVGVGIAGGDARRLALLEDLPVEVALEPENRPQAPVGSSQLRVHLQSLAEFAYRLVGLLLAAPHLAELVVIVGVVGVEPERLLERLGSTIEIAPAHQRPGQPVLRLGILRGQLDRLPELGGGTLEIAGHQVDPAQADARGRVAGIGLDSRAVPDDGVSYVLVRLRADNRQAESGGENRHKHGCHEQRKRTPVHHPKSLRATRAISLMLMQNRRSGPQLGTAPDSAARRDLSRWASAAFEPGSRGLSWMPRR